MEQNVRQRAKPHVESAITHYANVFRSIAEENAHDAAAHMKELQQNDEQAKESLSGEVYLYYEQQRNNLIRRFGERLVGELQEQLQGDMIDSAKKLIHEIEKIRTD